MINMVYFVELLLQGLPGHVDAERVFTRLQSRRWYAALRALLMAQPQAYQSQYRLNLLTEIKFTT